MLSSSQARDAYLTQTHFMLTNPDGGFEKYFAYGLGTQ
jgi:hypothetical protein